ncbi:MAG: HlyD family efflux transporter periplasmic adaptor subunit, partial [Phycisphaerae bacterium]|nr:HlyD family efflux transporter periplasmic adaptor subunit [Phycisphaerae bacterium]
MSGPTFRIAAWTAAVAALAGTLWLAFRPAPVPCDLGAAGRGPLTVTIDEDGRTRLKERYVVSSPLAGRVDRIALKAGDTVEAGATVLARIAPPDPALLDERARAQAQARVRSAEAALARAEPELARCRTEVEHLQGELRRVTEAAAAGAASQKDLEDQRLMLRSAELARDTAVFAQRIAAFELEQARAALLQHAVDPDAAPAGFEVRSPISGRVLRVVRESAGIVNPGDPLLEVGAPADLEIELDVLSDQAIRVRPGQRVAIERWGGDRPLSGVVRLVEPSGF